MHYYGVDPAGSCDLWAGILIGLSVFAFFFFGAVIAFWGNLKIRKEKKI